LSNQVQRFNQYISCPRIEPFDTLDVREKGDIVIVKLFFMDDSTDDFKEDLDWIEDIESIKSSIERIRENQYPATKVLVEEHELIKKALEVLVNAVKSGFQDEELYSDLARFFSEYADAIHHGKEEKILFEVLKKKAPEHVLEIVRTLEEDHVRGRELVRKIRENASSVERVRDYALAYASMLRDHIVKEDDGLFPAMHPYLSPDEENETLKEFERVDTDSKEDLEKLVKELASKVT
jgi:hemerythrin-like domain-containing protein